MTFSDLQLLLLPHGSKDVQWFQVTSPFIFSSAAGLHVEVPAGFRTDFASVPRACWSIAPPTGDHSRAAVIHDYLYSRAANCPRFLADAIFRHAMQVSGVALWKRWLMWFAVRLFGWTAYQQR